MDQINLPEVLYAKEEVAVWRPINAQSRAASLRPEHWLHRLHSWLHGLLPPSTDLTDRIHFQIRLLIERLLTDLFFAAHF